MIEKQLGPMVLISWHYLVFGIIIKQHWQDCNGDKQGAAAAL